MLRGLVPVKPGPKSPLANPLKSDVERLERENARLRERLTRAGAIIDLQRKFQICWACRRSRRTAARAGDGRQ
ncbi:hypothetical protein FHW79_006109 [Azospirillum sp. OGB3]|uniref:hypothetical protein n=1 Tax=Azospirillum sp. OGB3 TaxID=2587012 RepID=UPI001605F06D|nr:hypothetical protein [Azospirillum sp. OGB3]MBB3268434.1 hypothetical protein [Azospirillum sp. OGB3]